MDVLRTTVVEQIIKTGRYWDLLLFALLVVTTLFYLDRVNKGSPFQE